MTEHPVSRRRLLKGGMMVAVGAALGRRLGQQEAQASSTAPASLGALFTIKNGDAGTFVFKVRTDAPANVRVRSYHTSGGPETSIFSPWVGTLSATDPSKPRTHEAEIEFPSAAIPGVVGGHTFEVAVAPPDLTSPVILDATKYTVREQPAQGQPAAFSVAFGSCMNVLYPQLPKFVRNDHTTDVPVPALRRVVDPASWGPYGLPQAYFHLGDFGYPDASAPVVKQYEDDVAAGKIGFRSAFQWVKGHAEFKAVATQMPTFVVPDDHDYGQDGAYRGPGTSPPVPPGYAGKGPYKPYAAVAFQDVLPMYPFGSELTQPPNRVVSIGEIDFFLLDNRKFSDPQLSDPAYWENQKWYSLLGSTQRSWLKSSLKASTAKVKVVLAPQTFHYYWSAGERKDILNWIANNGVTGRILLLTGDKHCQGHFEWRTPGGPKVDEVMCSPIRNARLSPVTPGQVGRDANYSYGLNPKWTFTRYFPTGTAAPLSPAPVGEVVGFLHVDTTGPAEVVRVRLVQGDGTILYRRTLS